MKRSLENLCACAASFALRDRCSVGLRTRMLRERGDIVAAGQGLQHPGRDGITAAWRLDRALHEEDANATP